MEIFLWNFVEIKKYYTILCYKAAGKMLYCN